MKLSFNSRLQSICKQKSNSLCIGLDIDPDKFSIGMDKSLDGMKSFGKDIIDGTIDFCPVYKPNFAFFERFGSKGYAILETLVDHINGRAIVIADAKRGDIGNTSKQYAKSILDTMGCDAITISPYMGRDTIEPFIENIEKGTFVLAITSNPGASELQCHGEGENLLYNKVIKIASELNTADNIGLVVGATQVNIMKKLRSIAKDMPWLIPGIGTQGGDLKKVVNISNHNGMSIINISRSILYAGNGSIKEIIQSAKYFTQQIRESYGIH